MLNNERKRVGLALGGGAVRGLAHLGVLTVLEREGIPIDCVSGTSVGALIGAAYCAGIETQEMKEIATRIGWRDMASPTWPVQGFVTFAKMERWMVAMAGDLVFDDLTTPLAVVATDVESGQPVVLRDGRLAPAVRASCSVPGIVAPIKMNGRLLGDGGVTDNVPVAAVRALGADYVIGVDVCRPAHRRRLGPLGAGLTALETLVRHAGEGVHKADCLISPDLSGFSYVRFTRQDALIALGAKATEKKLPLIQAALSAHAGRISQKRS
jgi:NTE family protein